MPSKTKSGKGNEVNVFKLTHYISFYIPQEEKECREAIKTRLDWIGNGSSKIPKKGKSVRLELTKSGILSDQPIWWEDVDPGTVSVPFSELHEIYIMRRNSKKLIIDLRSARLKQTRLVFFEGKNADQIKTLVDEIKKRVKEIENEKSKEEKENELKSPSNEKVTTNGAESLAEPQQKETVASDNNEVQAVVTENGEDRQVTLGQTTDNLNVSQPASSSTETENKVIIPRSSKYSDVPVQTTGPPDYHEPTNAPPAFRPTTTLFLPEYMIASRPRPALVPVENGITKSADSAHELVPELNRYATSGRNPGNNVRIVFENFPMIPGKPSSTAIIPRRTSEQPKTISQSPAIKIAHKDLPTWQAQPMNTSRQTWQNMWYGPPEHVIVPRTNQMCGSGAPVKVSQDSWGYSKRPPPRSDERAQLVLRETGRYCCTPDGIQDQQMHKPLRAISYDVDRSQTTIWAQRYRMELDRSRANTVNQDYLNGNSDTLPNELYVLHTTRCKSEMDNYYEPYGRGSTQPANYSSNADGLPMKNLLFTYHRGKSEKNYRNINTMSYRPEYVHRERNEDNPPYRSPLVGYH